MGNEGTVTKEVSSWSVVRWVKEWKRMVEDLDGQVVEMIEGVVATRERTRERERERLRTTDTLKVARSSSG